MLRRAGAAPGHECRCRRQALQARWRRGPAAPELPAPPVPSPKSSAGPQAPQHGETQGRLRGACLLGGVAAAVTGSQRARGVRRRDTGQAYAPTATAADELDGPATALREPPPAGGEGAAQAALGAPDFASLRLAQLRDRIRDLKKAGNARSLHSRLESQLALPSSEPGASVELLDSAEQGLVGLRAQDQPSELGELDEREAEPSSSSTSTQCTPLVLPAEAEALPQPLRTRTPNPHLVADTWLDKTGVAYPGSSTGSTNSGKEPEPESVHLLEAHQRSYQEFLRHDFRALLEEVKSLATLSPNSAVIITREEADARNLDIEELPWGSPGRGITRGTSTAPPGAAVVRLGSLLNGSVSSLKRFGITLLPELLYFKAPESTPEQARMNKSHYLATAMLPARVSDGATGFTFEVHVELGRFPAMTDHGIIILGGNPYIIVHRLMKKNGVYYSMKDRAPFLKTGERRPVHILELVTQQYSRMKVMCANGKAFIALTGNAGKNPVPAHLFLAALGFTDRDLQLMRNYKLVVIEEIPSVREACEKVCEIMGTGLDWFNGDAVTAFKWRTTMFLDARIGKLGRQRFNERLGLNLPADAIKLNKLDILAAVDLAIDVDLGVRPLQVDDVDSLVNKRLRSTGEVLETLVREWVSNTLEKADSFPVLVNAARCSAEMCSSVPALDAFVVNRLWSENNRQLCDDTNALAELMQGRRVTQVGEMGLDAIKRIQAIRLIHPSQYGRICPIETGEGGSAGVVMTLAAYARITPDGEIMVPHSRVVNGCRLLERPWEYLLAGEQNKFRVAQFDNAHLPDGTLCGPVRAGAADGSGHEGAATRMVTTVHLGRFTSCPLNRVDYVQCAPPVSTAVATIPFMEHDDANRVLMGAKMQQQAVPCLWPERPIVGTGMEAHVASCSAWSIHAGMSGHVLYADSTVVSTVSSAVVPQRDDEAAGAPGPAMPPLRISMAEEEAAPLPLPKGWVEKRLQVRSEMACDRLVDISDSKKHTLRHHTCSVRSGDEVAVGEALADGSCIAGGELAIGKNVVVAYLPFEGYNYEDAIVVSKRCVREDIFTSVHLDEVMEELEPEDVPTDTVLEEPSSAYASNGLIREGSWVETGDVVIGIKRMEERDDGTLMEVNKSLRVPPHVRGRVVDIRIMTTKILVQGTYRERRVARALIATTCRIQVGDKLSGRHGNKGIVAKILDDRDMPYLPDGTPVDVILNPLGVPSRMNVGQIFECLLGTAGRWMGQEYRVGPFDEMYAEEASRGLVFEALRRAKERTGYEWLLDPRSPGKTRVYDGRTGKPFDQPVTAGVSYILKLYHMVKDKIVARGEGKGYSVLTQQPIKGRARGGGQRLGEMEVSALIGYGAHATLQEMMTIKSDDLEGRRSAARAIRKGLPVRLPEGATSEGYLTFRRELAAGGLAVSEGRLGGWRPPRGRPPPRGGDGGPPGA